MDYYTSITSNYLPKARVLAASVKRHDPQARFHLLLSDVPPPGFTLAAEPFDTVLGLEDLPIPNPRAWAFGHALVEMCTAVKGIGALEIVRRHRPEKLFYFDPDIVVFGGLQTLGAELEQGGRSALVVALLAALSAVEGTPASVRFEDEAQVEAWAAVAARRLTVLPTKGPFALSRLLRGLLVDEIGLKGDADDYSATRNCCLHQVLARRKGMPILLSCVWMEAGRRAGIPVEGIGMPGHFLVRVGGAAGVHVDTFAGGQELSREGCRSLHDRIAGTKSRWSDDFLRPSPIDQVLERVLNNLAATTR